MENKLKPLISVIIPIYKAEKYIEKCVRCLMGQTYKNLEIILVEDGSPDSSGTICDALALEDKRIRVIHKTNGGAATARNAGLDIMSGEYVTFVDADDYMEENYIETLYKLLVEHDAQVSICSFKTVDENGKAIAIDSLHDETDKIEIKQNTDLKNVEILNGNDIILQDLQGHWEHVAPWGKLFKADLYQKIRYPHWFAHEDEPVFIQVFDKVDTVAITEQKLYYYVQHAGSLMNSAYSEKDRSTYLQMWKERIVYYSDENPNHKELLNYVKQAYVAWSILYLTLHANQMTKEQQTEIKKEMRIYMSSLLKTPHLFNFAYSMKLLVKCGLTFVNINILRKRYK